MKKNYFFLVFLASLLTKANTPHLIFKENKGQWPSKVLYSTDFYNTQIFINTNSFNYCIFNTDDLKNLNSEHSILRGHNYEVNFINGDFSKVIPENPQKENYNYFLGNKKSKWANKVKGFNTLLFQEVYKGIDVKLYSDDINFKYDFIIKPLANTNLIRLQYSYSNGIEIRDENLIIKTSIGEVVESAPIAYQIINGKKKLIKCQYVLIQDNEIGFKFSEGYDKDFELIIDPFVVVCSYSGSSSAINSGCTYGENGNIYTISRGVSGYPTTTGAFQGSCAGFINFLVSGYNANGSSKIFSTFIGGDSLDDPYCIVARKNELIIMGRTTSNNFPTSFSGFDTTFNGQSDIAICKISTSGSSLLASTYIGGSGPECINSFKNVTIGDYFFFGECVCDTSGNVFAISSTNSPNFPTSPGAISTTMKGIDACVFKLDSNLSNLIWSTYLGGNISEDGKSLRLDGNGGVYCLGTTNSMNFPTTSGCISPTKQNGMDYFVTHINPLGNSIINSTYLGTPANDIACLLDLDENNDVYISGQINSPSSLVPTSGIYSNVNGYNTILKVNSSLSALIFQTKFGNIVAGKFPYLMTTAFRVDSCHKIYISGFADNTLPTTANAFMPYGGGIKDIYIAVFNNNCTSLQFASYYGGSADEHTDGGISHFDPKGILYQGFYVRGAIPTTTNAYSPTHSMPGTDEDGFLKVDLQTHVSASSSYGSNILGCPPFNPTFVSATNTGTVFWNLGNGVTSTSNSVSTTYTALGNYNVLLVVTDTNTCNKTDTIKSLLSVIQPTEFDLGESKFICTNELLVIESNITALTYSWSTGQTTSTTAINSPGTYTLTIDNGACKTSDDINVILGEKEFSRVFPNIVTPNEDGINDVIDFSKYKFEEVHFEVLDRWGRRKLTSVDINYKFSPSDFEDGTYFYVIEYKSACTGKYNTYKNYIQIIK